MAIDNSLYDSLQESYFEIQNYLGATKLGPEHSELIVKHEELGELLERLDIEAIEEQSQDIYALHAKLNDMKERSEKIKAAFTSVQELDADITCKYIVDNLDYVFTNINKIIV